MSGWAQPGIWRGGWGSSTQPNELNDPPWLTLQKSQGGSTLTKPKHRKARGVRGISSMSSRGAHGKFRFQLPPRQGGPVKMQLGARGPDPPGKFGQIPPCLGHVLSFIGLVMFDFGGHPFIMSPIFGPFWITPPLSPNVTKTRTPLPPGGDVIN